AQVPSRGAQRECGGMKLARRETLGAELQQPRAAGEVRLGQGERLPARVERIDDRVERRQREPAHIGPPGALRIAMPRSVIFFRSVFRLIPRTSAAFTWLPPTRSSTSAISGRSIAASTVS